jgi:hypothetical protein
MTATLGSAFTTAVRVIDRIHGRASNVRPTTQPTLASGFAEDDVHMIRIAAGANRGSASCRHAANFTAGQSDLSPTRIPCSQGGATPGRTAQHAASSRLQLNIVNTHA